VEGVSEEPEEDWEEEEDAQGLHDARVLQDVTILIFRQGVRHRVERGDLRENTERFD
jgi:hypothetical protein